MQILRLHGDHPEERIAQALEQALAGHCFSAAGVKQLVLRLAEPPQATTRLELPLSGDVTPVSWPQMDQFNRLLDQIAGGER